MKTKNVFAHVSRTNGNKDWAKLLLKSLLTASRHLLLLLLGIISPAGGGRVATCVVMVLDIDLFSTAALACSKTLNDPSMYCKYLSFPSASLSLLLFMMDAIFTVEVRISLRILRTGINLTDGVNAAWNSSSKGTLPNF